MIWNNFRMTYETPGIVFLSQYASNEEGTVNILNNKEFRFQNVDGNLPDIKEPCGIESQREWYLYEEIVLYCPNSSWSMSSSRSSKNCNIMWWDSQACRQIEIWKLQRDWLFQDLVARLLTLNCRNNVCFVLLLPWKQNILLCIFVKLIVLLITKTFIWVHSFINVVIDIDKFLYHLHFNRLYPKCPKFEK